MNHSCSQWTVGSVIYSTFIALRGVYDEHLLIVSNSTIGGPVWTLFAMLWRSLVLALFFFIFLF